MCPRNADRTRQSRKTERAGPRIIDEKSGPATRRRRRQRRSTVQGTTAEFVYFFSTRRPPPPLAAAAADSTGFFFSSRVFVKLPDPPAAVPGLRAVSELSRRQTTAVTLPPRESANYTRGPQNLLIFFTPKRRFSYNRRIIKRRIFDRFCRIVCPSGAYPRRICEVRRGQPPTHSRCSPTELA